MAEPDLFELRKKNYDTHSIVKRCFPPAPDECLICHNTGEQLSLHACIGFTDAYSIEEYGDVQG